MVPTPQEERRMLYIKKNNAQKLSHAIIYSSSIHWHIIGKTIRNQDSISNPLIIHFTLSTTHI